MNQESNNSEDLSNALAELDKAKRWAWDNFILAQSLKTENNMLRDEIARLKELIEAQAEISEQELAEVLAELNFCGINLTLRKIK